ncbi:MAG: ABC transporter permease [Treponema sp.]|jgi:simple sugar transport system permease protein|nr:ABC transporter permease [Treponema sp.]
MIDGLLTAAAPLILASLGALLTEFSGTLGVFIEGFMVLGSFFSWVIAGWTHSIFWGTLVSALVLAPAGWGLARFVRVSGANPFIASLALNVAAGSLADSLSVVWFGVKGVLRNPDLAAAPVNIPLVAGIPVIGGLLSGELPFAYLAWAPAVLVSVVMGRTSFGLRLKASGLNAEAARERGLNPESYREWAWAAAALLAGLGGAALSFRVGAYTPGGIAGRGWIALAAVYLGFRRVWGTVFAAVVFSLVERIGLSVQALHTVQTTVLLGLPSALALILYSVSSLLRKKGRGAAGV